ncbi:surfactin synthase thioesterase subunit [Cytobacillus purgationiresistens]|uniref:Surfactin synthase thioesterase subunit n=2 Tax=Cytobacillus purgationiresistens TaxID=863449 RepID=A0ABU0AP58_9BACI|nr:surfactin synthase thioesterase subunit [Cytobacillus purgationiresistens]
MIEKNKSLLEDGNPYNIFGHSMGGLLAYEFCQKINELGLPLPENLFVSAFQPPDIKLEGDIHLLPMDDFAEKMRKGGNIPESIFLDKDLYNLFIPILYADYKLVFQYIYKPKEIVMKNNLHIFTGNTDFKVYQLRKEWSRHTQGYFEDHIFEGGHFFIRESEQKVLEKIVSILIPDKIPTIV